MNHAFSMIRLYPCAGSSATQILVAGRLKIGLRYNCINVLIALHHADALIRMIHECSAYQALHQPTAPTHRIMHSK